MKINCFQELCNFADKLGPKRLAVVMADNPTALSAVSHADSRGIIKAILIGNCSKIKTILAEQNDRLLHSAEFINADESDAAAACAVSMARKCDVDIILKVQIRTDQLLRVVLNKSSGLRTGSLLSDIMLYEDTLSELRRLVAITDGGINISPDLIQKGQILKNAVMVMHSLGFARPRIALMSATEVVSEKVPSTLDAQTLTKQAQEGAFGECEVFGPLALDNALVLSAAQAKGIASPVAGQADVMLVPNIEAGNLLGKAVKYYAKSQCAHVVVGAKIPILIPSRVESVEDKVNSIALGAIIHGS